MASGSVLIAEDESINRMYLVSLLESHGFACHSVKNGVEAVAAFRELPVAAVLMDYRMPLMNGIQAVREIRRLESEEGGHVPIIVLTAYDESQDRREARDAGADLLLEKPFSETDLIELLRSAISGPDRYFPGT